MTITATVDRVSEQASRTRIDPVKILLAALIALPYVLGWVAGKAVVAVSYLWAAAKVGWQDARGQTGQSGPGRGPATGRAG